MDTAFFGYAGIFFAIWKERGLFLLRKTFSFVLTILQAILL
jgi:hypothetical protein